jgi:hypothetical protein
VSETSAAPRQVTSVSLRLYLFDAPSVELRRVLHPPWPDWMGALYELEQAANRQVDVDFEAGRGSVTASAALSALANELRHRLDVLAFVCGALESLAWDIRLDGETLLATAALTPEQARDQLEDAGVAGPLCKVTDIDEQGWPRLILGSHLLEPELLS